MGILNIERAVEKTEIDTRYDIGARHLREIFEKFGVVSFEAITFSFKLGYAQGYKARKAEEGQKNKNKKPQRAGNL